MANALNFGSNLVQDMDYVERVTYSLVGADYKIHVKTMGAESVNVVNVDSVEAKDEIMAIVTELKNGTIKPKTANERLAAVL
jgi:hypothetical protein